MGSSGSAPAAGNTEEIPDIAAINKLRGQIIEEQLTLITMKESMDKSLKEASDRLKFIENEIILKDCDYLKLSTEEQTVKKSITEKQMILNKTSLEINVKNNILKTLDEEHKKKSLSFKNNESDFLNKIKLLKNEVKILEKKILQQKIECDNLKNMKIKQNTSAPDKMIKLYNPPSIFDILTKNRFLFMEKFLIQCERMEYEIIERRFMTTTQDHFKVFDIKKIVNPHLMTLYILRKKEYRLIHAHKNTTERLLYRGIHQNKLGELIQNGFSSNFWNKKEGITFTTISNHANRQCDVGYNNKKIIIVANVLTCDECDGVEPAPTPQNKNVAKVYTKYDEDVFYPSYIIEFTGTTIPKIKI